MTERQWNMAEAAPSSPAQVTDPAGQSSTAAAAVGLQDCSSHGAGQYPQEAEHEAQIADLQASSAISFLHWLCCLHLARSHLYCFKLCMVYDWMTGSSERHVYLSRS